MPIPRSSSTSRRRRWFGRRTPTRSATYAVNVLGTAQRARGAAQAPASVRGVVVVTSDKVYEPDADGAPHARTTRSAASIPYSALARPLPSSSTAALPAQLLRRRRRRRRHRARRQRDRRRRLGRRPPRARRRARLAARRARRCCATPRRSVPGSTCSTRCAGYLAAGRAAARRPAIAPAALNSGPPTATRAPSAELVDAARPTASAAGPAGDSTSDAHAVPETRDAAPRRLARRAELGWRAASRRCARRCAGRSTGTAAHAPARTSRAADARQIAAYEERDVSDRDARLPCPAARRSATTFVDLGGSRSPTRYLPPEQLERRRSRAIRCTPASARRACSSRSSEVVPPEAHLLRLRLLLVLLARAGSSTRARYAAAVTERLGLDAASMVIEVASNDGYLLQNFVAAGIPVLGVEPAANVAEVGDRRRHPDRRRVLRTEHAQRDSRATGSPPTWWSRNNVLAHVPDLDDFVGGLGRVLKPEGVLTIEVPHLLRLIERRRVRHDLPRALLLLLAARGSARARAAHGLRVFDVEELPTHGGSLRIWACARRSGGDWPQTEPSSACSTPSARPASTRSRRTPRSRRGCAQLLDELRSFLRERRRRRARGSPPTARRPRATRCSTTAGVGPDDIAYVVDRSPHKQGRFLPGIAHPDPRPRARARRPARLPAAPALEPARRDHRSRWPTSATGAAASSSRCRGSRCSRDLRASWPSPASSSSSRSPVADERGLFARTFDRAEFAERGLDSTVAQASVSFNARRGHAARACTCSGRRTRRRSSCAAWPAPSSTSSSTCGRTRRPTSPGSAVELSAARRNAIYMPPGLAHGFLTLDDGCELEYLISTPYARTPRRACAGTIPPLRIEWPFAPVVHVGARRGLPRPRLGAGAAEGPGRRCA